VLLVPLFGGSSGAGGGGVRVQAGRFPAVPTAAVRCVTAIDQLTVTSQHLLWATELRIWALPGRRGGAHAHAGQRRHPARALPAAGDRAAGGGACAQAGAAEAHPRPEAARGGAAAVASVLAAVFWLRFTYVTSVLEDRNTETQRPRPGHHRAQRPAAAGAQAAAAWHHERARAADGRPAVSRRGHAMIIERPPLLTPLYKPTSRRQRARLHILLHIYEHPLDPLILEKKYTGSCCGSCTT
jgi:hypothetical protein